MVETQLTSSLAQGLLNEVIYKQTADILGKEAHHRPSPSCINYITFRILKQKSDRNET